MGHQWLLKARSVKFVSCWLDHGTEPRSLPSANTPLTAGFRLISQCCKIRCYTGWCGDPLWRVWRWKICMGVRGIKREWKFKPMVYARDEPTHESPMSVMSFVITPNSEWTQTGSSKYTLANTLSRVRICWGAPFLEIPQKKKRKALLCSWGSPLPPLA